MVDMTYLSLKNYFFVCIFNISPCSFTQIPSERARWMQNLIPHPTSIHTAYFWWTPLPQKQEIAENRDDDVIITFFQVFLFLGVAGSVGLYGQTRVSFNVPTKPPAHWPFWRQTTKPSEVSPEVILDGLAEDSSVLSQVL